MKTTDERPHLLRGLPERGVSPSGWLQTELAIGYQVHIPLHRSQKRQRRSARHSFQAPTGLRSPALEPGRDPFPSGHILQGRRINRSVPRRPAVPKRHPTSERGRHPSGVDTSFLAVPAPRRFPRSPINVKVRAPTLTTTEAFKAAAAQLAAGVLGTARLALSRSQRPSHRLNHHSHLAAAHPPAAVPR